MMDYQNYLSGGAPTYQNAMAQPQAPAGKPPMTMQEWQAYLAALTPEEQAAVHAAAINWGQQGGGQSGGGNPMEKMMGMFGGKRKSGEGG